MYLTTGRYPNIEKPAYKDVMQPYHFCHRHRLLRIRIRMETFRDHHRIQYSIGSDGDLEMFPSESGSEEDDFDDVC